MHYDEFMADLLDIRDPMVRFGGVESRASARIRRSVGCAIANLVTR